MSHPAFPTRTLKVRAAVVLLHEGRVLLMRQNDRPFWVLPGGTLEEGESVADCAVRELQEEADLTITLEGLLAVNDFWDERRQVVDITYLATCTTCPPETFSPPFPENINEIRWVPINELGAFDLKPQPLHSALQDWFEDDPSLESKVSAGVFGE